RRSLPSGFFLRRCLLFGQIAELPEKAAVEPILPAPDPASLQRQAIAEGDRPALSGGQNIKRISLRPEADKLFTFRRPAQISREHCAGAHGVDARLRQGAAGKADDVTRRKDILMPFDAKRII